MKENMPFKTLWIFSPVGNKQMTRVNDIPEFRARIDELHWGNVSLKLQETADQIKINNPVISELFKEKAVESGLVDDKGFIMRRDAIRLIVSLEYGDDIEFRLITTPQGWQFKSLVRKSEFG